LIKDVNVQAEQTKDNLARVIRKLFMRKKFAARLTALQDVKIWQYEVKSLIADLEFSSGKLDIIIDKIDDLQKKCVISSDNLSNVIHGIKQDLKDKISKLGYNIE
jgi:DNA repair ATPase RecN